MDKLETPSQLPTWDDVARTHMKLVESAKKEIVVIGGEYLALESPKLMDSLIEKLIQGISVNIFIYDPKPRRRELDKLISYGAKIFLTRSHFKKHYLVVDNKSLSYHSHKRYDDVLIDKDVSEEYFTEFNQSLKNAKRNALKLSHGKLFFSLSIILTLGLFGFAIYTLPFPLNIYAGIFCLAPFFLEITILKNW